MLAPPYDVITTEQRHALYGRNMRNIVRIDSGEDYPHDVAGVNDRYTRAASFLASWLDLDILVREAAPCVYVCDHEFMHPDGRRLHRRGVFVTVPARPWQDSMLRPHERTLLEPKRDRLELMRVTRMQTSPVFAVWSGAESLAEHLAGVATGEALLGGRIDGELDAEKLLLWRVDAEPVLRLILDALEAATLYVADGHHRYETSVEFGASNCLVYLGSAGDPALIILPTHRLVRPAADVAFSLDDLWARLDDRYEVEPAGDVDSALAQAGATRATHHGFAVVAGDGVAVLRRPREPAEVGRAALDVSVRESEVLAPAGMGPEAIAAGALGFTRDTAELAAAVAAGDAVLGFAVLPVSAAEVIAVADAGETMPQKSTYFYPKVPTGLVLYPV